MMHVCVEFLGVALAEVRLSIDPKHFIFRAVSFANCQPRVIFFGFCLRVKCDANFAPSLVWAGVLNRMKFFDLNLKGA